MAGLSIRWQNFRSLKDTGWRQLRPLTIVLGPNNSGKTSLIAPLLLMQQTLDSEIRSTALLTKGPLLDLGSFTDLVRNHDQKATVGFALKWRSPRPGSEAEDEVGIYPPAGLVLEFDRAETDDSARLKFYSIRDPFDRAMLSRKRLGGGGFSLAGLKSLASHLGEPDDEMANGTSSRHEQRVKQVRRNIRRAEPNHFLFSGLEPLLRGVEADEEDGDGEIKNLALTPSAESQMYLMANETAGQSLRRELGAITYIGPLRERARRFYVLSGEMPRNVGTRGEFAPEILFRWASDTDKMAAVNDWLGRFGFADSLKMEPQGTGAFSLSWQAEGSENANTAFVDMGFGLSQVLPLIVQGVLAPSGSTIVAEQPEIHLNPKLQTVLAELFAWCIERGVHILTETHSEHLLLTTRRLIASDQLDADDVALYFVEREDRDSRITAVSVGSDGHIPPDQWPAGFFGDALRESLALSSAQAKY
jgi:AAA ATPase domain/Protein of unknown function (DUF3696)